MDRTKRYPIWHKINFDAPPLVFFASIVVVIIGLDASDAPLALRVAQMQRHSLEIFRPALDPQQEE